jgi:hypothetical protein
MDFYSCIFVIKSRENKIDKLIRKKKHYKKFEKPSVIYSFSEERDFNGRCGYG